MKSYFNFLSRNKLYTAIETFGLSVALGFVIILGSYASMSYSVGKGNSLTDDVYCAGMGDEIGMTWGTPKEFYPSVTEMTLSLHQVRSVTTALLWLHTIILTTPL